MTAYLYILWAVEDELVKVGISRSLHKRISAHSGNSSNPLKFEEWDLFRFRTFADAKKIEKLVLQQLAARGLLYRKKKELFKCDPTVATNIVKQICTENGIFVLKNFPFDLDQALTAFNGFPCFPEEALEMCSPIQRKLYWKGIRDALQCISYLEGIVISRPDIIRMACRVGGNEELNSEIWTTIIDFYRNQLFIDRDSNQVTSKRKIASIALERIKSDRRIAYSDWQCLDDSDDDELTAA